jgi:hypothetical protein
MGRPCSMHEESRMPQKCGQGTLCNHLQDVGVDRIKIFK